MQVAFVALKALQWALKGQELASDTLEILLVNAYHWNPCWKVEEQCHIFGCLLKLLAKIQFTDFRYFFFWLLVIILFTSHGWFWLLLRRKRPLVVFVVTLPLWACLIIGRLGRECEVARLRNFVQELCDWLKIATKIRHTTTNWRRQSQITVKSNISKCCWSHGKL